MPLGGPVRPMPELISDTPENMARALFALSADHEWELPEKDQQKDWPSK